MTEFLKVPDGTLAYETAGGTGPLLVLAHGTGDSRQAYRFLVPALVAAGYRVASLDLRGCGESSVTWPSATRTDIAGDIVALIEHLGGPAIVLGHSISGGAATIAAATAPSLVTAVVELAPFTRKQQVRLGDLAVTRVRRGAMRLVGTSVFGSIGAWKSYLEVAYPGTKPADWEVRMADIEAMLRQPGRMKALQLMTKSKPTDAGAQLANVRCPVLVIEGSLDPDWASPRAEGEAIVAALPAGLGTVEMIGGAGHYPHQQFPEQVLETMLPWLESVRA
jgi:pimeloyl-ACP methyl ester carboxylesterase